MFTAIAGGLINWITTNIIVESELTRPLREWVGRRRVAAVVPERKISRITDDNVPVNGGWLCKGGPCTKPANRYRLRPVWNKVAYLLGCHLCVGTWVGLVEAIILGPVIGTGVLGIILTALLFKAVGHLTLEGVALIQSLRGEQ